MSNLSVSDHDGSLVVDSRLIAAQLEIEHESFMRTIENYKDRAEQTFGVIRFEIGKPSQGSKGGRPERYALLTEDQATFIMTLSRNTSRVVACKLALVKAFSEAKQRLQHPTPNADRSLVGEINTLYGQMEAEAERVKLDHLQLAKQIGDRLLQLKATLKHGQWEQFRFLYIKNPRTGLPMPTSTATLFQRISKHWDEIRTAEVDSVRDAAKLLRRWVSANQPKLTPVAKPPADHPLVTLTRSLIATGCTPDIAVQEAGKVLVSEERLVIRTETNEAEA